MEGQNWVAHAVLRISWIGSYWWRTSRVRVEKFPRTHNTAVTLGNPKNDGGEEISAWTIWWLNHLHVDVQRQRLEKSRNNEFCKWNSLSVAAYARRSPKGHWSFLGPGTQEAWCGTHIHKPNGSWNDVAELMMINLRESGHPLFRGTSVFFRGAFKIKGGGRSSIHYNADPATAELLLRIIISVKQLSIYGAVSDWCEEFAQLISDRSSSSTWNPVAKVNDESESKSHPLLRQSWQSHFWSMFQPRETWCSTTKKDSKTFQKTLEGVKPAMTLIL